MQNSNSLRRSRWIILISNIQKKNPGISSLWVMISNYMDTLTCYAGNENLKIHFLYSDRGLAEADKVKVSKYPAIVLIR